MHELVLICIGALAAALPFTSHADEKFVLPAQTVMTIDAVGAANYTQEATIKLTSRTTGRVVVENSIRLFWSQASFTIPVSTMNEDLDVEISGRYLYTDSDWGASKSRISASSPGRYVIGFDDSQHNNGNPDNDFDDLVLSIRFKACDSVPNKCLASEKVGKQNSKCWEEWWDGLASKPMSCPITNQ